MGYTIIIGNAELERTEDNYRVRVNGRTADGAPNFPGDDVGAGTGVNERWPSYSAWAEFLRNVGLYDMFIDKEEGLMRDHPGCKPITVTHVEDIEAALKAYKAAHPDAVPMFVVRREGEDFIEHLRRSEREHIPSNGWLLRLEWLAWWCRWAVTNCENPAIYNS